MDKTFEWIPLMDYAAQTGVSLSTLRRHIKANKIEFRLEDGRYLLKAPARPAVPAPRAAAAPAPAVSGANAPAGATSEIHELRKKLQRAQEEISELKMLVAIYEEQQAAPSSPALPKRGNPMRMNG